MTKIGYSCGWIATNDISLIDFSQIKEDSSETLLRNTDNSKALIEWKGEIPSSLIGTVHVITDINSELAKPEWTQGEQ